MALGFTPGTSSGDDLDFGAGDKRNTAPSNLDRSLSFGFLEHRGKILSCLGIRISLHVPVTPKVSSLRLRARSTKTLSRLRIGAR